MTDATFIAKTADLLHFLKYATIQTSSPADAAQAKALIAELQAELALTRDRRRECIGDVRWS
jgi:hypothetical protein